MSPSPYALTSISSPSVSLNVDYSGPISGICGIRFNNDPKSPVTMKTILNELNLSQSTYVYIPVVVHTSDSDVHTATADFRLGLYVARVVVTTKTGAMGN